MASCSILVDDGNLCGEAPLWDVAQQVLYWTDCVGRKFYAYDWKAQKKEILLGNFEVNGCALDQSGGFTFTNNSGVWFWNKKGKPVSVASTVGNVKLQLNDCIADPEGRLLAGSCFYDPSAEYPLGKLFSIQPEERFGYWTKASISRMDSASLATGALCILPTRSRARYMPTLTTR